MTSARTARREFAALAAGAIGLMLAAILQAPGKILPETKLDLVLNPGQFLHRAFHIWDPGMDFGRLQNQAAGYLFPMGPFYWLGHELGVPGWLVQRLWIGGLLALGFVGVARLADALRIGSPLSRWLGAAAYALGPASLTLAATRSGTQTTLALLPWILLPLVRATPDASPRRVAARSGLAIAAMGAVNGAAALLVLAAPVIWLATRPATRFRNRLAGWWVVATGLATAWWIGPLALQGKFGYDFTTYTERASLTTSAASATETLRGTGNWLAYVVSGGHLWQPGGWEMIANRWAIVGGIAVAAVGLAGLARRELPERAFLGLTALAGVLTMSAGYSGSLSGPAANAVQRLLDGPLVVFRNVNKAQPLLALPLALAIAHLAGRLSDLRIGGVTSPESNPGAARRAPLVGALALTLAIVGGGLPLFHGRLPADGTFTKVPSYWTDVGHWLDHNTNGNRSLILPAAPFGEYTWGRPLDEPLVSLTRAPLAERDLIPLGSNAATRLLDAVEGQLEQGQVGPGTAPALARVGVQFLVVRNDLDPERTSALPPGQLRRILAATPGIARVAQFGPRVDPRASAERLGPVLGPVPGAPADPDVHAVEIYRIDAPAAPVSAYPVDQLAAVSGGSESVLTATGAGLRSTQGTVLPGDVGSAGLAPSSAYITDTTRRRDVDYGDVHATISYTLTANERVAGRTTDPQDRLDGLATRYLAVAEARGGATVRASSYGLDPFTHQPQNQPFAAFDGDPNTMWQPSLGIYRLQSSVVGQWIELDLDHARDLRQVTITLPNSPSRAGISELSVQTDHGQIAVPTTVGPSVVSLPKGATRTLRITIAKVRPGAAVLTGPAIVDVQVPGLTLTRPIATTAVPEPSATAAKNTTFVLDRARVDPFLRDASDEDPRLDRIITTSQPESFAVRGTASVRRNAQGPLPGLDPEAAATLLFTSASSTWSGQAALGADSAVDSNPTTSWVAAPDDTDPTLTLHWTGARAIDQIRIVPAGSPAQTAAQVVLSTPDGEHRRVAATGALVQFDAVTTDTLTISAAGSGPGSIVAGTGSAIGLGDVEVPQLQGLNRLPTTVSSLGSAACGLGPALTVDGQPITTRLLNPTTAQLLSGDVPFVSCDAPIPLTPGQHHILGGATGAMQVDEVVLARTGGPIRETTAPRSLRVRSWQPEKRTVSISAGAATVVALAENQNSGWHATLNGTALKETRIDGWRQAWVVPAGSAGIITMTFAPQTGFAALLGLGALLLLLLAAAALVPVRRAALAGDPSPAEARSVRLIWVPAATVLAVLTGLVLGGPIVVAVAPLLIARRKAPHLLPWAAGLAMAGAAVVVWMHPGGLPINGVGTFSAAAQIFSVVAISAVAVALIPDETDAATPEGKAAGSTPPSPPPSDAPPPAPDTGTTPAETGTGDRPQP